MKRVIKRFVWKNSFRPSSRKLNGSEGVKIGRKQQWRHRDVRCSSQRKEKLATFVETKNRSSEVRKLNEK